MATDFNPARAVILLEDSSEQINSVRKFVESRSFLLLAAPDVETVVALADCGAKFFILDIKLGDEPERFKAGLNALEILRVKYGATVFIAILTAVKNQHLPAIEKLRADVCLDKRVDKDEDLGQIFSLWEKWASGQPDQEASQEFPQRDRETVAEKGGTLAPQFDSLGANELFPSNDLALKITGATQVELARIQQERRRIARALGQRPPRLEDLVQEIGTRMREELRGAIRELVIRSRYDGKTNFELTNGVRLSGDLVRLVFRLLPITYGADEILGQLREELYRAASRSFSGEWGTAEIIDGQVVVIPLEGSARA